MSEKESGSERLEAMEKRLTEAERQIAYLMDRAKREDDLRRQAAESEFGPIVPPP